MFETVVLPKKHAAYDALGSIADSADADEKLRRQQGIQQSQFAARQQQDTATTQKQTIAQILTHYISIQDPQQRDAARRTLESQGIKLPPDPPVQPSQAEQNQQAVIDRGDPAGVPGQSMIAPSASKMSIPPPPTSPSAPPQTFPTGPLSGGSDIPDYQGQGDTLPPREAPSASDRLNSWVAQREQSTGGKRGVSKEELDAKLAELTGGDELLARRAGIEAKVEPTWKEKNIEQPMVAPEIGLKKAQTGLAQAGTAKDYAEIPKIRAETSKLSAETEALKAKGASDSVIGQSIAKDLITNPRAYFSLPPEDKKLAITALRGRVPVNLNAQEIKAAEAADAGLTVLEDIKKIEDKWAARGVKITGPMLGRYEVATQRWGAPILPSNLDPAAAAELQGDYGRLREWITVGPMMEASAIMPRPAYQMMEDLKSTYPALYQNEPIFEGAMSGVHQRLEERKNYFDKKAWGPNGPPDIASVNMGGSGSVGGAGGTGKPLDKSTAASFLKMAGGDKEKARQLAKKAGFGF